MGAFSNPTRVSAKNRSPNEFFLVAKATGGIKKLFFQIKTSTVPELKEYGSYTDASGCFEAINDQCLLALRYRFLSVLGSGQSAVVIKAQDTYCGDLLVAIKILHAQYYNLGGQETDCFVKLQASDPFGFSPVCKLLNTFSFDDHFCMVFELLHCPDWNRLFHTGTSSFNPEFVYSKLRKTALRLFQVLGFLQSQNVIHADLKPDNLLLKTEGDLSSLCVADLGNAIQCVYREVSLYYDDFELQTLIYRAPEVIFGLQFGPEIDMWSVGCILAEFFLGRPLFYGNTREEVLRQIVAILGPVPRSLVQRGKFYTQLEMYTFSGSQPDATNSLRSILETGRVRKCTNYALASFLSGILKYDPAERPSDTEAACHPFLAPETAMAYLVRHTTGDRLSYPSILLSKENYHHKPHIDKDITRGHPTTFDLLQMGTSSVYHSYSDVEKRRVAEVTPFHGNSMAEKFQDMSPISAKGRNVLKKVNSQSPSAMSQENEPSGFTKDSYMQKSCSKEDQHIHVPISSSPEIIRERPVKVTHSSSSERKGRRKNESGNQKHRRSSTNGSKMNIKQEPVDEKLSGSDIDQKHIPLGASDELVFDDCFSSSSQPSKNQDVETFRKEAKLKSSQNEVNRSLNTGRFLTGCQKKVNKKLYFKRMSSPVSSQTSLNNTDSCTSKWERRKENRSTNQELCHVSSSALETGSNSKKEALGFPFDEKLADSGIEQNLSDQHPSDNMDKTLKSSFNNESQLYFSSSSQIPGYNKLETKKSSVGSSFRKKAKRKSSRFDVFNGDNIDKKFTTKGQSSPSLPQSLEKYLTQDYTNLRSNQILEKSPPTEHKPIKLKQSDKLVVPHVERTVTLPTDNESQDSVYNLSPKIKSEELEIQKSTFVWGSKKEANMRSFKNEKFCGLDSDTQSCSKRENQIGQNSPFEKYSTFDHPNLISYTESAKPQSKKQIKMKKTLTKYSKAENIRKSDICKSRPRSDEDLSHLSQFFKTDSEKESVSPYNVDTSVDIGWEVDKARADSSNFINRITPTKVSGCKANSSESKFSPTDFDLNLCEGKLKSAKSTILDLPAANGLKSQTGNETDYGHMNSIQTDQSEIQHGIHTSSLNYYLKLKTKLDDYQLTDKEKFDIIRQEIRKRKCLANNVQDSSVVLKRKSNLQSEQIQEKKFKNSQQSSIVSFELNTSDEDTLKDQCGLVDNKVSRSRKPFSPHIRDRKTNHSQESLSELNLVQNQRSEYCAKNKSPKKKSMASKKWHKSSTTVTQASVNNFQNPVNVNLNIDKKFTTAKKKRSKSKPSSQSSQDPVVCPNSSNGNLIQTMPIVTNEKTERFIDQNTEICQLADFNTLENQSSNILKQSGNKKSTTPKVISKVGSKKLKKKSVHQSNTPAYPCDEDEGLHLHPKCSESQDDDNQTKYDQINASQSPNTTKLFASHIRGNDKVLLSHAETQSDSCTQNGNKLNTSRAKQYLEIQNKSRQNGFSRIQIQNPNFIPWNNGIINTTFEYHSPKKKNVFMETSAMARVEEMYGEEKQNGYEHNSLESSGVAKLSVGHCHKDSHPREMYREEKLNRYDHNSPRLQPSQDASGVVKHSVGHSYKNKHRREMYREEKLNRYDHNSPRLHPSQDASGVVKLFVGHSYKNKHGREMYREEKLNRYDHNSPRPHPSQDASGVVKLSVYKNKDPARQFHSNRFSTLSRDQIEVVTDEEDEITNSAEIDDQSLEHSTEIIDEDCFDSENSEEELVLLTV